MVRRVTSVTDGHHLLSGVLPNFCYECNRIFDSGNRRV